jgi:hypothetical protein
MNSIPVPITTLSSLASVFLNSDLNFLEGIRHKF